MAGADMAVSILLLLTVVTQAAVALTDSTLTTDQLHTVLCVWTVAHSHFAPGRPLSSRCQAQSRKSPAAPSVILCHRGTICKR